MKGSDFVLQKSLLRPISIGLGMGVASCFLVLITGAFVLSVRDIPLGAVSIFSVASLVVGAFVSGYVCTVQVRERGLFLGMVCATLLFVVLVLAGLTKENAALTGDGVTSWAAMLFAGALGGVLGVNKKRRF